VPPKKKAIDRNGQLEAAVAVLIYNQAHFLALAARIESELAEIKSILIHHQHILDGLPEAIREKIGFAPPKSRS
jgi:hypothetical protein